MMDESVSSSQRLLTNNKSAAVLILISDWVHILSLRTEISAFIEKPLSDCDLMRCSSGSSD